MSPNASSTELVPESLPPVSKAAPREYQLVYPSVLVMMYYHVAGLYGLYVLVTDAKWMTVGLAFVYFLLSTLGVTAGAHRLFSHRSYTAKWPLQVFLMLCHSASSQHSLFHWVRDHRLHHLYSDTDADPHNSSRGFFYSHIGWLMVRKHPEVRRRGKWMDLSDLEGNGVVMFQHRNSTWFIPLIAFVLPTLIPYFWGESIPNAWHVNLFRYVINLNMAFTINSVAHIWGYKPYDSTISPGQNKFLFFMTLGEGSHNFHHVFPWDYRTDGLGLFNVVTRFIDLCAGVGLVHGRKVVRQDTVKARAERTGDGSTY